ncbi:hypothetical protein AGROH133_14078 [Agrobacterium tumefaciens]|nr:hypothetical protein AGROH133_14078 [Agrobacterium tumefaciens]
MGCRRGGGSSALRISDYIEVSDDHDTFFLQ